ncbi:hypothetical protein F5884DRAFT_899934 [Xylogone sp. PMI_703]|nr:hypothetical protein F5884DRAFT_899934 [Xylogone sp. PMI_703]
MTSRSEFGQKTTSEEVIKAFGSNATGKTVLITGVSPKGIGEHTALAIASHSPALIILASRTAANISTVADNIHSLYPSVATRSLILDLGSLVSVRAAAKEVMAYPEDSIDIVINNAGILYPRPDRRVTVDGFEQHLQINHLGHFLFDYLIISKLRTAGRKTGDARLVLVSSNAIMMSPVRFSDINVEKESEELPDEEKPNLAMLKALNMPAEGKYIAWAAYGQSKTAMTLAGVKWAELLAGDNVTVVSLNPGAIETNLQRNMSGNDLGDSKSAIYWKSLSEGASTTLVAALDPALKGTKNLWLEDCQVLEIPKYATDKVAAEKTWELSQTLVGEKFQI